MSKFSETGAIIREHQSQALGTLGADVALIIGGGVTLSEDFRILKSQVSAFVAALTAGEGQGLMLGVANGELSVAEIKECLEADGPTDRNDRELVEKAERQVHIIGMYQADGLGTGGIFLGKQGEPVIEDKFRWTYSDPEGWNFFVYNAGAALTTGAALTVVATHYGVWVT